MMNVDVLIRILNFLWMNIWIWTCDISYQLLSIFFININYLIEPLVGKAGIERRMIGR